MPDMADATIRDLRNHGGEVIDRVMAGERVTITRATAATLIERFKRLPAIDPDRFRADVDVTVDQSL